MTTEENTPTKTIVDDSTTLHKFDADITQLMSLIINSVYSDKEIFIRELISNSSDALDKIRYLSITDQNLVSEQSELHIKIQTDEDRNVIIIEDTGIGMSKEELIFNLGTIARSGTKQFIKTLSAQDDYSLIGQFGIGFYSVFLVCDKVEVRTKQASGSEHIWTSLSGTGYESWDGSSMASPNAASAIGLLSAYHPDWDNVQLRNRIEESADRRIYEVNPDYESCNGNSGVDCLGKGMVDIYKAIGMDFSPNLLIESSYVDIDSDNDPETLMDSDSILNPGETGSLYVNLQNEIGWVDATSVNTTLTSDNDLVTILENDASYGNISNGSNALESFRISVDPMIDLGDIDFTLFLSGFGDDGYVYFSEIDFSIEVSLSQEGFPYDTNSELRAAPVVIDLDNDNDNEIIMADYFGMVRLFKDGQEVESDVFPYDTGDQIWGSISSADVDLDGLVDLL